MIKKLAILDGDIVAYRCAAATEKRYVECTHKQSGELYTFDTATKFKEWLGENEEEMSVEDFDVEHKRKAEPVSHTLRSVKASINKIVEGAKCDSYHICVSGEGNFRLDLPLPTQYKSNREELERPVNLKAAKQYLIDSHNAEIVNGKEADDRLVEYAYQGYRDGEYVVQCSIDKDAYASAGWLYNWTNMDEPELIEGFGSLELVVSNGVKTVKGKGRSFLYWQIAYGDSIDGYKPCDLSKQKFGTMKAWNFFKDCKTDKDAVETLAKIYKGWYPKPVKYRDWQGVLQEKNWVELMQLYADCAFMQRWDGDRLDIPKLLEKFNIKEN